MSVKAFCVLQLYIGRDHNFTKNYEETLYNIVNNSEELLAN